MESEKSGGIDFAKLEYLPLNIGTLMYDGNNYVISDECRLFYGPRGFYCPRMQFHLTGESLNESLDLFCMYVSELASSPSRKIRKIVNKNIKIKKL